MRQFKLVSGRAKAVTLVELAGSRATIAPYEGSSPVQYALDAMQQQLAAHPRAPEPMALLPCLEGARRQFRPPPDKALAET